MLELLPEPCCSVGLLLSSQLCISVGFLGCRFVFLMAAATATGLMSLGDTQSCMGMGS